MNRVKKEFKIKKKDIKKEFNYFDLVSILQILRVVMKGQE